jgi:hypothetical protein
MASNPIVRMLLMYLRDHVLFGVFLRGCEGKPLGAIKRLCILFTSFGCFMLATTFTFVMKIGRQTGSVNLSDSEAFVVGYMLGKVAEVISGITVAKNIKKLPCFSPKTMREEQAKMEAELQALQIGTEGCMGCWARFSHSQECSDIVAITFMAFTWGFNIPFSLTLPPVICTDSRIQCEPDEVSVNVTRALWLFLADSFLDFPFFLCRYAMRKRCCPSTLEEDNSEDYPSFCFGDNKSIGIPVQLEMEQVQPVPVPFQGATSTPVQAVQLNENKSHASNFRQHDVRSPNVGSASVGFQYPYGAGVHPYGSYRAGV